LNVYQNKKSLTVMQLFKLAGRNLGCKLGSLRSIAARIDANKKEKEVTLVFVTLK